MLEVGAPDDQFSRTVDAMIMVLVFGNVLAVILESVASIGRPYHDLFVAFERVSVAAFTAEFLCRIWSAVEATDRSGSNFRNRLRDLGSPMAIVDLLAIAPAYLSAFFVLELRFLRIMRRLRIVRLTRYSRPRPNARASFPSARSSRPSASSVPIPWTRNSGSTWPGMHATSASLGAEESR